jgi:succinate dehydrogenase / fumarate reductase membrane anchor subunit
MHSATGSVHSRGSAREGAQHWKMQRLTAIANVPLALWFIFSAVSLSGADHAAVAAWLARPLNATLMLLLVLSVFYHARLGLQVVVEDYVHHEGLKVATLVAITFALFLLGGLAVVSILKVALGS